MAQATSPVRAPWAPAWWLGGIAVVGLLAAVLLQGQWLPAVRGWLGGGAPSAPAAEAGHDHAGHDHAGHDHGSSIELSESARKNIGLVLGKVELTTFTRSIVLPGIAVERPGRSTVEVTAPLTGVVTRIYPLEGEAVTPGQKLFDLRLTHEELVQSQAELLRTAEELDVVGREIERIEKLTQDGGLATKTLLERKYEQQKQQGVLRAQRQALLLHGLSNAQIDAILQQRTLLQSLTVVAPPAEGETPPADAVFQVQSLKVSPGKHVTAGDTLALLADHAELFIQGDAFERDTPAISRAAGEGGAVSALIETERGPPQVVSGLKVFYLASQIDPESRTLHFFVQLPNQRDRDGELEGGRRIIAWRFRPGQRMQLQIQVETLPQRIVLPAAAIAQDGAETYIFVPNGKRLDRRAVHVEYRDPLQVVIANDGKVFPGEPVALSGAQQLLLALKNAAGGGIDPHAGHNH